MEALRRTYAGSEMGGGNTNRLSRALISEIRADNPAEGENGENTCINSL